MDKSCLDGIGMLLLKEGKYAVNSIYSSIVKFNETNKTAIKLRNGLKFWIMLFVVVGRSHRNSWILPENLLLQLHIVFKIRVTVSFWPQQTVETFTTDQDI